MVLEVEGSKSLDKKSSRGSMDQGLSGLSGLSADRRMEEGCATHASVHLNPEELGRHELERGDGMEVGSDLGCATHASVHMDPEELGRHDRGWAEGGRVGRSVVHCPRAP